MSDEKMRKIFRGFLTTALVCASMCVMTGPGFAQQLEEDPSLVPLHQNKPTIHGNTQENRNPAHSGTFSTGGSRTVLKGNITTLDTALVQEKDTVDWYGWYMACREYLLATGGLNCSIGALIRFNRNGQMTSLTPEPGCMMSVARKRFPLPPETKLDAIILPVRSGKARPATPEELYYYLKGSG